MSKYRSKFEIDLEKRLPFRIRKRFGELEFPAKLEQYLLAEAAGVVASVIRDEEEAGNAIIYGDNFWYFPDRVPGSVRPLLVAHVDTVCSPFPPNELVRHGGRITNPAGILGADDRAGVYGVLEVRKRTGVGVLLCDEEERGAHGARAAARELGHLIKVHPYMIELDRRGHREVVYYREECFAFMEHVESYGFNEENGSFSDISVLSRELDIPGANLSIGFYSQHSKFEHLELFSMWDTIARVQKMIEENRTVDITPVISRYKPYRGHSNVEAYRSSCWWDKDDVDTEVIDIEDLRDKMTGRLTPEEHDHLVALDLEAKDAERVAYLEKRAAEWEAETLAEEVKDDEVAN